MSTLAVQQRMQPATEYVGRLDSADKRYCSLWAVMQNGLRLHHAQAC